MRGMGLDFETARIISALPEIVEFNIGHFLIARGHFHRPGGGDLNDANGHRRPAATVKLTHFMIIGFGTDLCDIVASSSCWSDTVNVSSNGFSPTSSAANPRAAARAASYAKRFAAKEACAKALGTGMSRWRRVARHGRCQFAVGQADPALDRRRRHAARGLNASQITNP